MTKANAKKKRKKERKTERNEYTQEGFMAGFWQRWVLSSRLCVLVICIMAYPITTGTMPHMVAKARKKGLDSFVLLTSHLHITLFSNSIDIQFM